MNTSSKGNRYEWLCQRRLEANGWSVQRAAASHGPFDLIAWRTDGRRLAWIQCKDDGRECDAADNAVVRLPDVPYGDVLVVHRCRGTCRRTDYFPEETCLHVRFPGLNNDYVHALETPNERSE